MHRGFLRSFGISHDIMPITTAQAIAKGFRVFLPDVILCIVVGVLLFVIYVLVLYWLALSHGGINEIRANLDGEQGVVQTYDQAASKRFGRRLRTFSEARIGNI